MCVEELARVLVPMNRYALERVPWLLVRPLRGRWRPDLRPIAAQALADAGQVGEEQAGGLDRVVPGLADSDERQLRLDEDRELERLVEDARVGRDEPVSRLPVVVQR
jgi:hypothetical protein